MFEPIVTSGYNTFNILWKDEIFTNSAPIKYLDVYEASPNNRYIFGCGDKNQDRIWVFRMLSVNKAMPDSSSAEAFRLFRFRPDAGTSDLLCSDVKALNTISFIIAANE